MVSLILSNLKLSHNFWVIVLQLKEHKETLEFNQDKSKDLI